MESWNLFSDTHEVSWLVCLYLGLFVWLFLILKICLRGFLKKKKIEFDRKKNRLLIILKNYFWLLLKTFVIITHLFKLNWFFFSL
jgi:hypothetical protein